MKWYKLITVMLDGALIGALIVDIVFTVRASDEDGPVTAAAERVLRDGVPEQA